jgi:hypothetical protein
MKVVVYPADEFGCGYHRMIWPAGYATELGCDVTVVRQKERVLELVIEGDTVKDVRLAPDVDVVVFQRTTHFYLMQAIAVLRLKGISVVIDVDDDLTLIHPLNGSFANLHPNKFGKMIDGQRHLHSWQHLVQACRDASLVTVSTPALLGRYAAHGRGRVLHNYLEDRYFEQSHEDSTEIVWPASAHSHPDDPAVVGPAIARLVDDGERFTSYGFPEITARAFGLREPTHGPPDNVAILDWAGAIARHGIGIAPLSDTRFNHCKSWLKPLELAAVGVPWVGSPRPEYQRLHDLGCGLLARKPKDWYGKLKQLCTDDVLRKELSEAGQQVAETLRLRRHAWRWIEAWTDAMKIDRVTVGRS